MQPKFTKIAIVLGTVICLLRLARSGTVGIQNSFQAAEQILDEIVQRYGTAGEQALEDLIE